MGQEMAKHKSKNLKGEAVESRKVMQNTLQTQLACTNPATSHDDERQCDEEINKRLNALEKDTKEIRDITDELRDMILAVQSSVTGGTTETKPAAVPKKPISTTKPAA